MSTVTSQFQERTAQSSSRSSRGALVRFFNPLRLAAYLLVLYALGHTAGAVVKTPKLGAASDAVAEAMKTVHLSAQGADCTWYGFYRGFGWLVTVFFVFSAVFAWHLGGADLRTRRALAPVTWTLVLSYLASLVVSWAYFFPAPIAFSTAITALLGIACLQDWRAGQREAPERSRA